MSDPFVMEFKVWISTGSILWYYDSYIEFPLINYIENNKKEKALNFNFERDSIRKKEAVHFSRNYPRDLQEAKIQLSFRSTYQATCSKLKTSIGWDRSFHLSRNKQQLEGTGREIVAQGVKSRLFDSRVAGSNCWCSLHSFLH